MRISGLYVKSSYPGWTHQSENLLEGAGGPDFANKFEWYRTTKDTTAHFGVLFGPIPLELVGKGLHPPHAVGFARSRLSFELLVCH